MITKERYEEYLDVIDKMYDNNEFEDLTIYEIIALFETKGFSRNETMSAFRRLYADGIEIGLFDKKGKGYQHLCRQCSKETLK